MEPPPLSYELNTSTQLHVSPARIPLNLSKLSPVSALYAYFSRKRGIISPISTTKEIVFAEHQRDSSVLLAGWAPGFFKEKSIRILKETLPSTCVTFQIFAYVQA